MDYTISLDHNEHKRFGEIQRSHQQPTKAQAKLLGSLAKKIEKLSANIAGWRGQIADLRSNLYDYHADIKPLAGAVLHLDHSGDLAVTCGLIRQEDRDAIAEKVRSAAKDGGGKRVAVDLPTVKTRPVHSEALTNRLQAQRVMALQTERSKNGDESHFHLHGDQYANADGAEQGGYHGNDDRTPARRKTP